MFSVLRRFSVLMTMYGELYILKLKKPFAIQLSIYMMIFGSIVAALYYSIYSKSNLSTLI